MFSTLKTGHRIKECQVTKKCRKCDSRHYQSICHNKGEESIKVVNEVPVKRVNNKGEQPESREDPGTGEHVSTNTVKAITQNQILLQTATVMAYNDETESGVPVRILMDSGSQRSYVQSSLKERLGLKAVKTQTIHLCCGHTAFFYSINCQKHQND